MLPVEAAAEVAAYDHAVRIARQPAQIRGKTVEARPVSHQILLDIRCIESRNLLTAFGNELPDCGERVVAGQIADDGNHEVAFLE
jgi:hypothetical protein